MTRNQRRHFRGRRYFFASVMSGALVLCVFLGGCGKNDGLVAISGTVKLNGQPLENGDMSFAPADGNGAMTDCQVVNGKYTARVSPGKLAVKIYSLKKTTDPSMKTMEGMGVGGNTRIVSIIPPEYNEKTTLSISVSSSEKKHDFDLKVPE